MGHLWTGLLGSIFWHVSQEGVQMDPIFFRFLTHLRVSKKWSFWPKMGVFALLDTL